ncbi:opsin-5-like, partial [Dreissena polymorpha]|uniref:opsin-5-like n=1 Tax=Dreissena polymorpha TaxID=45954 RepID=UPI0022647316
MYPSNDFNESIGKESQSGDNRQIALGVVFVLLMLCGLLLNSAVLFTFKSTPRLRTHLNVFIMVSTSSKYLILKTKRLINLCCVLVGFFASWLPYAILSLWSMVNNVTNLPPTVALIPAMFVKSSC